MLSVTDINFRKSGRLRIKTTLIYIMGRASRHRRAHGLRPSEIHPQSFHAQLVLDPQMGEKKCRFTDEFKIPTKDKEIDFE